MAKKNKKDKTDWGAIIGISIMAYGILKYFRVLP